MQVSSLEDALVWSRWQDVQRLLQSVAGAMQAEWEEKHSWGVMQDLEGLFLEGDQQSRGAGIHTIRYWACYV